MLCLAIPKLNETAFLFLWLAPVATKKIQFLYSNFVSVGGGGRIYFMFFAIYGKSKEKVEWDKVFKPL